MSKGRVWTLVVGAVLLAGVAAVLLQPGPTREFQPPIDVVLSVDPATHECVQEVKGIKTPLVQLSQNQQVRYSTATGQSFTLVFEKPAFLSRSTGSPFVDPGGGWQTTISSSGSTFTTGASQLTEPELFFIRIGVTSLEAFPYQSISIGGSPCKVQPNTGVHVDP
jgi:hypothetical protein